MIRLEDKVKDLVQKVQARLELSFAEFSTTKTNNGEMRDKKLEVIVSFLAILELVKQRVIDASQSQRFAPITVERIYAEATNDHH